MIHMVRVLSVLVLFAFVGSLAPPDLAAQSGLGGQTLGRGYWHMFVAYAIAWLAVLGWVVSIARRLARVEDRIEE